MRAQLLEGAIVRALAEQVQIEVAQHPAVAIRIVNLDHVAAAERDAKPVVGRDRLRQEQLEHTAEQPVHGTQFAG